MALIAVSLLPIAAAQAHGPDPVLSDNLYAQDQVLEFRWRSGAEPPAAIKTAIKDAAADITASRGSRAATFVYDAGGASPIGYGPGATCGVNGIACFTRSAPNTFTMWLREHGRVFDWGTLKWCQMYTSAPNGCYDVETIALDEFGHIEVLGHHVNYSDDRDYLDAVVQTYSRTKPKTGWDEHTLGRCDVATLQREYDVPSSSTKVSTCLDLDTTASITASTSATIYGGIVKFTAVLKIAAVDSYGRLKGNALSGRSVKLQRRAPGTTTWTTVATMTAAADGRDVHGQRHDHRRRRVPIAVLGSQQRGPQHRRKPRRGGLDAGLRGRAMCLIGLVTRRVLVLLLVALTLVGCGSRPAGSGGGGVAPSPSTSAGRPTAQTVPSSSTSATPPEAALAAEGGDPVPGQLGSYTWDGTGSESPWLPGAPIAVGAGESLSVTLVPPTASGTWRARYVPAEQTDAAGAPIPRRGHDGTHLPGAAAWSLDRGGPDRLPGCGRHRQLLLADRRGLTRRVRQTLDDGAHGAVVGWLSWVRAPARRGARRRSGGRDGLTGGEDRDLCLFGQHHAHDLLEGEEVDTGAPTLEVVAGATPLAGIEGDMVRVVIATERERESIDRDPIEFSRVAIRLLDLADQ